MRHWEPSLYKSPETVEQGGPKSGTFVAQEPHSSRIRYHLCPLVCKEQMSFPRLAASINSSWDKVFLCFVSGSPQHVTGFEAFWPWAQFHSSVILEDTPSNLGTGDTAFVSGVTWGHLNYIMGHTSL